MLNWLVRMWHRFGALIQGRPLPQQYHRSNLRGRYQIEATPEALDGLWI